MAAGMVYLTGVLDSTKVSSAFRWWHIPRRGRSRWCTIESRRIATATCGFTPGVGALLHSVTAVRPEPAAAC
ncbi:UNVERIFIED_ORG: hypothetical protein J2X79_000308 [Arthrobacter globiformis]|nr:hypothetical protein [Arthrobacter globiformis]